MSQPTSPIYRHAVVSVGVGGWYPQGLDRLNASLDKHSFNGVRRLHRQWPHGCPSHQDNPYAFKVHAMRAAMDEGCRAMLWLDAADWAVAKLDPLFNQIDHDGHFFMQDGWTVGQWSTEQCLEYFGLSRDEAMEIPLIWANAFGISTETIAKPFLDDMQKACDAGCFRGPWENKDNCITTDPRCFGHRHDQTVASILVWCMELALTPVGRALVQPVHSTKPNTVIAAQGL